MISVGNLFTMMNEVFNQDRIIDENTSVFINELKLQFKTNNIDFPMNQIFCLNKLLYLINLNYFEEISKSFQPLTREKLIDHIISRTITYYKNNGKLSFDENDAQKIIDYCLLIKPKIKEEIITEFKASRVKVGKEIDYAIKRRDLSSIDKMEQQNVVKKAKETSGYAFDITSLSDLHTIIVLTCNNEYYQEFGNPYELDWDMDFLSRILTLIAANYRQQLIEIHPDYSNLALSTSLITNSITYALVNKRKEVGQREILSTFQNWHYIPFSIQDKILTKLFEEDGLDYSMHPYRDRRDPSIERRPKVIKLGEYKFARNVQDGTTED